MVNYNIRVISLHFDYPVILYLPLTIAHFRSKIKYFNIDMKLTKKAL